MPTDVFPQTHALLVPQRAHHVIVSRAKRSLTVVHQLKCSMA